MSDRLKTTPDLPWLAPGVGLAVKRHCMGCNQHRETPNGRGIGLRWRCAACVALRRKTA
jgi:hypothetical protein